MHYVYNLLLSGKWNAPDVDPCRNRGYKQMTSPNPGTDALVPLLLRLTTIAPQTQSMLECSVFPGFSKSPQTRTVCSTPHLYHVLVMRLDHARKTCNLATSRLIFTVSSHPGWQPHLPVVPIQPMHVKGPALHRIGAHHVLYL